MKETTVKQLETPIAFFLYRRPGLTEKSFAAIKRVRPKKLYLIADGPKSDAEKEKCEQARKVVEQITWPCEVLKNYSDVNVGLRQRTVSGLNWVFKQEPEAIVLEDDVVAEESFFYFCQELLIRYRDDKRIFQIAGATFQQHNPLFKCDDDYYYSRIPVVYGWAAWRRSWEQYDDRLTAWPRLKKTSFLKGIFNEPEAQTILRNFFDDIYHRCNKEKGYAHWSWQWIFSCLINNGLIILPKVDLTSNIGIDKDGTNVIKPSLFTNLKAGKLSFPLKHCDRVVVNREADNYLIHLAPNFIKSDIIKLKLVWGLGVGRFFKFFNTKRRGQ